MTREEAERIAGLLVTVEPSRPPFINSLIVVAGIVAGLEQTTAGAQRRAADWRDAIVRTLVGE